VREIIYNYVTHEASRRERGEGKGGRAATMKLVNVSRCTTTGAWSTRGRGVVYDGKRLM